MTDPVATRPGDNRDPRLWLAVNRLIATALLGGGGGIEGITAHKLGPLAASWFTLTGAEVPAALREEQRAASVGALLAPALVARIRAAVDGELLLLKGPEVAARYPRGGRRYSDVDVLVRNADAVQAALIGAGFVPDEDAHDLDDHHHLHPLRLPEIWLGVEVHSAPNWPPRVGSAPPLDEIFAAAVPSALGVEGVSAPSPLHHTLLLAAHAWRHSPLFRLRDLLDIAVMAETVPAAELERTAERWGIGRVWRTTERAIDALFYGGRKPVPLRLWAAHLPRLRERTIVEEHLRRWLHPYWELPLPRAVGESGRMVGRDLSPGDEDWGAKLSRTAAALRHPFQSSQRRQAT